MRMCGLCMATFLFLSLTLLLVPPLNEGSNPYNSSRILSFSSYSLLNLLVLDDSQLFLSSYGSSPFLLSIFLIRSLSSFRNIGRSSLISGSMVAACLFSIMGNFRFISTAGSWIDW